MLMRFSVAVLALLVLYLASMSPAQAGVLLLAPLLPHAGARPLNDPAANRSAVLFAGQSSDRIFTDCALAATGAAVAADDTGIYKTIAQPNNHTLVSRVSEQVTKAGDLEYVGPVLGLVYLSGGARNHDLAWKASIAVIKAGVVADVVKVMVGRSRPDGPSGGGNADKFSPLSFKDDDNSFPSGHATVAFAVASVWAVEKPREAVPAYALASLVGLSRIELGRHWPSDVFWGAVLGITQGRQATSGNTRLLNISF